MIKKLQKWRDVIRRQLGILLFDHVVKNSLSSNGAVVFVRWDAKLGDAIVSSWVAREIKKRFPERKIYVITNQNMAYLFRDFFQFDKVFEINKRASYSELKNLAVSLGHIEYLVHFSQSMKMKDLFFISQVACQHVAGLDDDLKCISLKLGKVTAGLHFSKKFEVLLNHMGIVNPDTRYIVPYIDDAEIKTATWWPSDKAICFNPYGSGRSRKLNYTLIVQMLDIMLLNSDRNICLLFPPEMQAEVARINDNVLEPARVFLSKEQPSIAGLFSIIRHSQGLVSVDTSTIHIAAGLQLPILGLYNPDLGGGDENFKQWHPNRSDAKVVFSKSITEQNINSLDLDDFIKAFVQWNSVIGMAE